MNKINVSGLFESELGKKIYSGFKQAINDFSMHTKLNSGVLVGFSGGADSVMLLCLLIKYSSEISMPFKVLAVHINHKIRGAEADRDEEFSRSVSKSLGVEFVAYKIDVPKMAEEMSVGIEEAARNARYSKFNDIMRGRNDVGAIAVAHNSTDNLETVLFNILRGSGSRGVSGIAPVRENIIRPLIYVSKSDIVSALNIAKIPFVFDSSNAETDYTRNYIRANVFPHLMKISQNPEEQFTKMCANLRSDNDFIESEASKILSELLSEEGIAISVLKSLHYAVFSRVISAMAKKADLPMIENVHITKIYQQVSQADKKDFSISIPGGVSFISKSGMCYIGTVKKENTIKFYVKLKEGINFLPNTDDVIILSYKPFDKFSLNVYKIAIQQVIDFDIINGELFAREKQDGDSYKYGGMTHKLKKMFNDKSIPPDCRTKIPIVCDNNGILWVPGFSVRDGGKKTANKKMYIALAHKNQL